MFTRMAGLQDPPTFIAGKSKPASNAILLRMFIENSPSCVSSGISSHSVQVSGSSADVVRLPLLKYPGKKARNNAFVSANAEQGKRIAAERHSAIGTALCCFANNCQTSFH